MPANGRVASSRRAAARAAPKAAAPVPQRNVLMGWLEGSQISASFDRSKMDLIGCSLERLHQWASVRAGPLQIVDGRNQLAEKLLESSAEWLFMVDSDMGFERDTLERLLAVADPQTRPVVGALCFALREWGSDGMGGMHTFPAPTLLNWIEHDDGVWRFTGQDHYPVNAMVRTGATGAACIVIHRSVFERIAREGLGKPFDRVPCTDGQLQGEDVSFCWRLQELGIPVWVHTGIRTTHFKNVWLAESDFWQSRIAPAATERVDVIVPALHRPQNVATFMRSLRASTGLATAWFVCEPGDDEEQGAVTLEDGRIFVHPGTFAEKVNAIYQHGDLTAPWLFLVGDDVRFRPGWLDQALDVAGRWKADVVGTNDLLNERVLRGEHATHMLIRRRYIDEVGASWDGPGVVCHEGYHHVFVDDEIVMAARLRGGFQAALGSHVEHLHPLAGKAATDDVYREGHSQYAADKALYEKRLRVALRAPNALSRHLRVLQEAV